MQTEQFQLHAEIEERHWWFVGRRLILSHLLAEVVPPGPQSLVIDVGCGTGGNAAMLACHYPCVGIDTSAEAIEQAARRFPTVRFIHGFAPQDLGPLAQAARAFLLTDVLEHVPDDFQLLSELLAASRPGAYFLVTVPADLALWSEHDESFGHYRRYDLARFAATWEGLPVSTLLVSHFNSRFYPLIRLIRAWNRRRGHAGGVAGTDFRLPHATLNTALTRCFAGERALLSQVLRGQKAQGYRRGVSLVALLRREEGVITPRKKPAHLEADFYDPVSGRRNNGHPAAHD